MKFYESESIELKRELTNDLEFEVVSFLNSHSGTIYIGVNNDGEHIGRDMRRIMNHLKKEDF